jgi:RNA polymerase sigma-70 factor (ECF subfamily)
VLLRPLTSNAAERLKDRGVRRTFVSVMLVNLEDRRARFEALVPALVDPLRRYLARRTDPATAEDVLSDTLLVCWRRFEEVTGDHLPWAYGVARNCLANAERARRRQLRLVNRIFAVRPPQPSDDGGEPLHDELLAALSQLGPVGAEVLRLWAWEELGPAEIATVLGMTPNAVSIRLHRAKQKLRDLMRKGAAVGGHEESRERKRP